MGDKVPCNRSSDPNCPDGENTHHLCVQLLIGCNLQTVAISIIPWLPFVMTVW